ncbi:MAG: hypothetical protein QXO70_05175, partial [Candidatus Pacearchaeota archaeon]
DLLGYAPKQTILQQIPESQWNEFSKQRGLNQNSYGIYLPRNQTAVVRNENPLSLFHEYFGHGLYCEQNLTGRKLVDLEKRLLEEEIQEFSNSRFSLEDLQRFRKQSQTFQELEHFRQENLERYELFAIWTEYLLSGEHGLKEDFERKYDSLSGQEKEAVDSVINFSENYGNLATMYAQGMARRTTLERVRRLLGDIYKDKLKDVRFALLYGSKKEFSDIDVFMVGEGTPNEAHSDWLDVKYKSYKEFTQGLKNFDVRILTPLMNGEIIFGDKNYFEQARQQIQNQLITEEAIRHNLKWSFRMQRLRDKNLEDNFLRNKFEGYSQTYLANALALRKGIRLFKREDLLFYSQRASVEDDKPPQLQGGT